MSRFSVIIPLYNKAPYVRRTLESVYAQTYRDFECIVVDDGSTDGSLDVVRSLDIGDCKSEIISQANAGVAAARNNGVAKSKGEYVCFLDADDWWDSTFLEELDKLIKDYPEAGIYCTNYVYYKPGKTRVMLDIPSGYINYAEEYLKNGAMPITSITCCIPRPVFDKMGGFPERIKLGEDFLLWAKIALHYKVAFCEKPLAYYNNDIPTSHRATRNLHEPQYHMLFNLDGLEKEIVLQKNKDRQAIWQSLLDWLRVNGLLLYWMSPQYHIFAENELDKVNWSKQPSKVSRRYRTPIIILKLHSYIYQIGSYIKQYIIRIVK